MIGRKNTYGKYLLLFSVIPVIVVGIILTVISTNTVDSLISEHSKELLYSTVKELSYSYELLSDDEDVSLDVDGNIYLGAHKITGDYEIVDRLKEYSGAELTVFYQDVRIVTTLTNSKGERFVDTKATAIWEEYISRGQDYFSEKMNINGVDYFACYIPFELNGEIIGMCFAGIPCEEIDTHKLELDRTAVFVCSVLVLISLIFCLLITTCINKVQNNLIDYLNEINEGKYGHEMNPKLYSRNDEFGYIGKSLVKLNASLDTLIRKDVLTGLYNRRAAMKLLGDFVADANKIDGTGFCLAIGDIDFFKSVNDTYGHNCGDEVLKRIAAHINSQPEKEGFAARWGGEEFVIAFKGNLDDALKKLEVIADNIRNDIIEYGGKSFNVTMTFGIVEYRPPRNLDELISNADILLYKGKESGRNKIVS